MDEFISSAHHGGAEEYPAMIPIPGLELPSTATTEFSADATTRNSTLLREWAHAVPNQNTTSATPPEAPAFVLSDESSNSQSRLSAAYSPYLPVATFVTNFVRTTVDHITDQINATSIADETSHNTEQANSGRTTLERTTSSSSIQLGRVCADLYNEYYVGMPLATTTTTTSTATDTLTSADNATGTSSPQSELQTQHAEGAERQSNSSGSVMVDGNLIVLPASQPIETAKTGRCVTESPRPAGEHVRDRRPHAEDGKVVGHVIDEKDRHLLSSNHVRRSVKGFRKWIKRCARRNQRSPDSSAKNDSSSSEDHSTDAACSKQENPSGSEASSAASPKHKSKKQKKRRAWRRSDSQSSDDDGGKGPSQQQDNMSSADRTVSTMDCSFQSAESVEASFVGNVDEHIGDGVRVLMTDLAGLAVSSAEAYIELASFSSRDTDHKVDKAYTPDVETMLRRATRDLFGDPEQSSSELGVSDPMIHSARGSNGGKSCGLNVASPQDDPVNNDILKVVMVGSSGVDRSCLVNAIRQSTKKSKRRSTFGVDVHTWHPENGTDVKFSIWDTQGSSCDDASANFCSHPGIQSLFFSSKSLYLLTWDLAVQNVRPRYQGLHSHNSREDEDDNDWDGENEFFVEEAKVQEDLALVADIENRVLTWVDCISRNGPESAIVPVVIVSGDLDDTETERRCELMRRMLLSHVESVRGNETAPKLLACTSNVISVNLSTNEGIDQLRGCISDVANDNKQSIFAHVGAPLPSGTLEVMMTVRRLKKDHKLVLVDHLMAELGGAVMDMNDIREALHFLSSIGEVLYFGCERDEILSRYIILSRKWFTSVLSCVLRNDLKRELAETRRFMNLQCIYSDQEFPENDIIESLHGASDSNCPLLSATDAKMLWQSMSFMREAADRSSLAENSTTSSIFDFLVRLLVQSGVLVPLGLSRSIDSSELYFIPSLLTAADPNDIWTYKSSDSWMTTLCHSWLFRDSPPSDIMEHITVSLLRDLFEFSRKFKTCGRAPAQTCPTRRAEFSERHDTTHLEQIKIHHMMCWKSSFLVKVGCVFVDSESGEWKESFVEIFVSIQDESTKCVASDAMRPSMQRLIVCGKGQVGFHGRKLWKGGYGVVLDSIKSSLASFANVDRQVVCPECLAQASHRSASTWSWDTVRAAASTGVSEVRCIKGHRVDADLICGTCNVSQERPFPSREMPTAKPVQDLLNSVVLVCLWDDDRKTMRSVGSGFFVDKKLGLIVTAGHVLFNMEPGRNFGMPYFGLRNAKVMVGVISDDRSQNNAVYRYCAEIVAENINSVDACVLRLTGRLERDVDQASRCGDQPEIPLDMKAAHRESLRPLKMTTRFELEETVRILGYNQGGEGVLTEGMHINRSADFAKGYICKKFQAALHYDDDDSSCASSTCSISSFAPREEIVIMCPTISGHSGGPCVNNDGKVVGILSRADPVDRQRCYLVPSSEIVDLVKSAKRHLTRPYTLT